MEMQYLILEVSTFLTPEGVLKCDGFCNYITYCKGHLLSIPNGNPSLFSKTNASQHLIQYHLIIFPSFHI